MIGRNVLEEDILLKQYAHASDKDKPRLNWSDFAQQQAPELPGKLQIKIEIGGQVRDYNIADVADTVGGALTDLLLSRKEENIFNDENQKLVAGVAKLVTEDIVEQSEDSSAQEVTLNSVELTKIIERALVKNNAHDVARSLIMRLRGDSNKSSENDAVKSQTIKVIRRNGKSVSWKPNKIEIAVTQAFLSLQLDPSPAAGVANGVSERIIEEGVAFINIEDLQDKVQEELMRQGHFKVAEAYILYRAHRALLREAERVEEEAAAATADDPSQDSLILVRNNDDSTFLWDGADLRKRIEYASLDLDLCLSEDEIERELRRSVFPEMNKSDLEKTIILNAKSLIERDADFSKFAARILLTFIYEEVLEWNIVDDGISELPAAHRKGFKSSLQKGIEIGRLNSRLREHEIDKLAEAIDPAADLDFDYLGIQTLYDRYLIVDKTTENHRRLETPQLFWMRVSMG
ncbi:MAG: ATP cone domain-containing protein, partial [Verrucomicrobiota bacterium]|nr:ATP cone domain-containing protein [Verrucomicrobiota bacterium]